jgi:DNA mismatch repair protein MutS2
LRKPVPLRLPIVEGAKVRLKDVREIATVRRILKNGNLEVEAGFMKMQIPREDVVEVVSPDSAQTKLPKNVRLDAGPTWDVTYREINVIGQRAEEALEQVDKFIDSAALASINRVRIIHGHGMGILKRAVAELLASNPHVSRHYAATQAEGGAGATIGSLNRSLVNTGRPGGSIRENIATPFPGTLQQVERHDSPRPHRG